MGGQEGISGSDSKSKSTKARIHMERAGSQSCSHDRGGWRSTWGPDLQEVCMPGSGGIPGLHEEEEEDDGGGDGGADLAAGSGQIAARRRQGQSADIAGNGGRSCGLARAAQASGAIGKEAAYTPVPFKPWCAKDSGRGLVKNADSDGGHGIGELRFSPSSRWCPAALWDLSEQQGHLERTEPGKVVLCSPGKPSELPRSPGVHRYASGVLQFSVGRDF